MEPRKMVRLLGLPRAQRLPVVSDGLQLLADHVRSKRDDAALLHKAGRHDSGRLLATLAREEAAKAAMLLDAVRVAWKPHDRVEQWLGRSFYDHLSRLNLAEIYDFPAHLDHAEIQELLDMNRDSYFVDGPNDVDWVFRNRQLSQREGLMYVDFCLSAGKETGEWVTPGDHIDGAMAEFLYSRVGRVVDLLLTLQHIGLLTLGGLHILQNVWRGAPESPTWQVVKSLNGDVLDEIHRADGLLEAFTVPETERRLVLDTWHMPLLAFELSENRVSMHATEQRRKELEERFLWSEYGPQSESEFGSEF